MNRTRMVLTAVAVLAAGAACGRTTTSGAQRAERPHAAGPVAQSVKGIDAFHRDDQRFFAAFTYPEAAESEVYETLDEALGSATAVVVAQVTGVRVTRLVGETPEDALPYMGVSLRPIEVLRGALPPAHTGSLTVEFVAPAGSVAELRAMLPSGYAVWVLRNKAERPARGNGKPVPATERDFYRLVSSQTLFVQGETHVVNPLEPVEGPEIPLGDDSDHGAARRDPVVAGAEAYASLSSLAAHARLL